MEKNNERFGMGRIFERIKRITGYLAGMLDKWNNAKKAKEADRVMQGIEFTATEGFFDLLMGKEDEEEK